MQAREGCHRPRGLISPWPLFRFRCWPLYMINHLTGAPPTFYCFPVLSHCHSPSDSLDFTFSNYLIHSLYVCVLFPGAVPSRRNSHCTSRLIIAPLNGPAHGMWYDSLDPDIQRKNWKMGDEQQHLHRTHASRLREHTMVARAPLHVAPPHHPRCEMR